MRGWIGWSDTALKIHLHRLEEMEYVLVHRAARGQSYVYEMLYAGEGQDGGRFVMGLIDAATLAYDGDRSGQNDHRSAPGQGAVRGESAPGQPHLNAWNLVLMRVRSRPLPSTAKNHTCSMAAKGNRKPKRLLGDPTDPHGFGVLVPAFLEWMQLKNYSERTISNREVYLRYFIEWCAERGVTQPAEVTKALIERYQRWIYHYRNEKTGRAMSTGSQFVRIVPVRTFFKWAARQNHTLYNPASELDLPKLENGCPSTS